MILRNKYYYWLKIGNLRNDKSFKIFIKLRMLNISKLKIIYWENYTVSD